MRPDVLLQLHRPLPIPPPKRVPSGYSFQYVPEHMLYGDPLDYTQNPPLMERTLRLGGMCFVAEHVSETPPVGHLWAEPASDTTVLLTDGFVKRRHRGRNLLDLILAVAASPLLHEWGYTRARTEISKKNLSALAVAQRLGFVIDPDTPTDGQFFATVGDAQ